MAVVSSFKIANYSVILNEVKDLVDIEQKIPLSVILNEVKDPVEVGWNTSVDSSLTLRMTD